MHRNSNLFERLLDPANGLTIFMVAIGIAYCLVPLIVATLVPHQGVYVLLAAIAALSLLSMWIGSRLRIFDSRFKASARRIRWHPVSFIAFTWVFFILFLLVTFATAPSIPFLSALSGADANALSMQRGAFLKGREGLGVALLYVSTFFINTVIPYSIVLLYERKSAWRHIAAIIFFLYCISFLQKALFLNLILPIIVFLGIQRRLRIKFVIIFFISSIILLIATTSLSLRGEFAVRGPSNDNYLTAQYVSTSPLDYFIWRAAAVPIFTAADTLRVYNDEFNGRPLMGATSSLIATLTGRERINIERFVFKYQFGSWNDTANANSVFILDGFVNFGWIGVVIFGIFVGQIFRWFRKSRDVAFKSLWLIFAFILFSAPLIGMLLSNGFAYMLFHALFIRVQKYGTSKHTQNFQNHHRRWCPTPIRQGSGA